MVFVQEKNLSMDTLVIVCTDGTQCKVGENKVFVALLHEHLIMKIDPS